jgi:hypothetical protein
VTAEPSAATQSEWASLVRDVRNTRDVEVAVAAAAAAMERSDE